MILSHVPKRSPEANLYILKNSCDLCRHGHMLNLWLLLASSPDMEDKAGVHSFLFHCLFLLGGLRMQVPEDKWPDTSLSSACATGKVVKELLRTCHAPSWPPSPVLAPRETALVHSGFRAKVTQGCGLQDTRAHYLVIPSNTEALVESSVGQWRLWSTAVCQKGKTDGSWPSSRAWQATSCFLITIQSS